jgi:hypothetical protein
VLAAGAVLVVAAWFGWQALADDEPGLTPADTVTSFFEAQRQGDCALVLDLVTESSRSGTDGRPSGSGFLDRCAQALVGYSPAQGALSLGRGDDGDRISVSREDGTFSDGVVVREQGEWRVEVDAGTLTVGRSPEQTLRAYLDAYNAGDCDVLLTLVAPATRTRGGELSEPDAAARCEEIFEASADRTPLMVVQLEMGESADGVVAEVTVRGEGRRPTAGSEPHRVQLVWDGLAWTLGGISSGEQPEARPADGPVPLFD